METVFPTCYDGTRWEAIFVKFEIKKLKAEEDERQEIYRLRYLVYTCELHQHGESEREVLTDELDAYNEYIGAYTSEDILAGFISITPPGRRYSLDKYRDRTTKKWMYQNAYELRILTVREEYRREGIALRLMEEAAKYVEKCGGRYIISIGREELMPYYEQLGYVDLQEVYRSGKLKFHLMFNEPERLRARAACLYERKCLHRNTNEEITARKGGESRKGDTA